MDKPKALDQPSQSKFSILNSNFFNKLKSIKGIKILLPILLIMVLVLLYFMISPNSTKKSNTTSSNKSYLTALEYTNMIESKLSKVLSKVKGAGQVDVIVTLISGPELVCATTTDKKTNTVTSNGNTTTNVTVVEEPIVVESSDGSSLLVLSEKMPVIKGVLVVSSGASDVKVKLDLLSAVLSVIDVTSNNVQIIAGN